MKKFAILILVFSILSFVSCTPEVDLDVEKAAIEKVLQTYIVSMVAEDMEGISNIFAHDEDMISFGTDAGERIVGWSGMKKLMEKQFAASDHPTIRPYEQVIRINSTGNTAWFTEYTDWKMMAGEEEISLTGLRLSGVLDKGLAGWKIVQLHFSVPVEGQVLEY
ncbi:MAG: nuclear transport factor 2 family protein [Candidatus Cloacimonetes bacterium]|nr:nuclear transport factor 2 family protein [Candidatus Cloacimonadota bacterium]MCF7814913.1 nuclear transport factor 2 family protein [Candidatus Cloacimonadota bacterium]MCF7868095.1 nuclear transport factor 2 family protein [Candidatus Cloacimonadota bacterium]MCF7883561.1 nuclear transport factor 2 family protein [Candidatus Cloacimonadota bacterium]